MIKAGIIGSDDSAAAILIKVLLQHPDVELIWVCDAEPSLRLDSIYPYLTGDTDLTTTPNPDFTEVDVVFITSLHAMSPDVMAQHFNDTLRVVDLTGHFKCAGGDEQSPFVYGLSELNRKRMVHDCLHVVCPSTVSHVVSLALLPLAKNLMLNKDIHATVIEGNDGNMSDRDILLALDTHPEGYVQEIKTNLGQLQTSFRSDVLLSVFRCKALRGALATLTVDCPTSLEVVRQLYDDYYDDHHFTFVIDQQPSLENVAGTNKCLMSLEKNGNKLLITAVIDNRIKGKAGTAVHDMNLLFGLQELVGLMAF